MSDSNDNFDGGNHNKMSCGHQRRALPSYDILPTCITPNQWEDFIWMLESDEHGCGITYFVEDDISINRCNSADTTRPTAVKILKSMGFKKKDIKSILIFCDLSAGHCDCEIALNSDRMFHMLLEQKRAHENPDTSA